VAVRVRVFDLYGTLLDLGGLRRAGEISFQTANAWDAAGAVAAGLVVHWINRTAAPDECGLRGTSRRTVPTHRSASAFARGARTGMRSTPIPAAAKTASNAAVNLVSRSRSTNRNRPIPASRFITRFRACCATHSPTGCAVRHCCLER
jgi:hypothetical protein